MFRKKKTSSDVDHELGLHDEALSIFRGMAGLVFELCHGILRDIRHDLRMENRRMRNDVVVVYREPNDSQQ